MTIATAAIAPVLGPVRQAALKCNGGYQTPDSDLIEGVVNIALAAGWDLDEIAEDPTGAVQEFLSICDFRAEIDAHLY